MNVPKFDDFDENQQKVFMLVAEEKNKKGEKVTVDEVIKEYYLRDQLNRLSVKH